MEGGTSIFSPGFPSTLFFTDHFCTSFVSGDENASPTGQALCLSVCLSSGVGGVGVFPVITVLCNLSLLLCQENLLCNTLIYSVPAYAALVLFPS